MKSHPSTHTVIALFALLAALSACKPEQKQIAPPAPPKVEVLAVRQADIPVFREWVGTLDGSNNAAIQAQVSGYLIKQDYVEGKPVKQGQLLFELDARPFQAAVDQAKGNVDQCEAQVKKTQMDVDRYTPLAKDDAISQQELDDAVQALAAAKAALESAKATLENAKVQLGYTKITSPVSGIAGISSASIGELISPGRGDLAVVSTIDPIKADFMISEQQYLDFRENIEAYKKRGETPDASKVPFQIILANGDVYGHIGHFLTLDRQVGAGTGSIQMQAIFPNPDLLLRPGQFAKVRAKVNEEKGALLVPQRAVNEVQGVFFVAVVGADKKVSVKKVEVGERFGSEWIIKSGLKAGEQVVAEGIQKARDGVTVEPVLYSKNNDKSGASPAK